jgi:hypothetical protein
LELSGVSFAELKNTRSISAATLTLHYVDELQGGPCVTLANALAEHDDILELTSPKPAQPGAFIQIDREIARIEECLADGCRYVVVRGVHGSEAAPHEGQTQVHHLISKTVIAPFPPEFFGSPYSGSWSHSISLPAARVASATLYVTNRIGNSRISGISLTNTTDRGLRTLSGGQYTIQVDGFLAVDQFAAPPLVLDSPHVVQDVFAVLGRPADGPVQLELFADQTPYCGLYFAPGASVSTTVDGNTLPPLAAGSMVTLAIASVGQTQPGADLTVLIRL